MAVTALGIAPDDTGAGVTPLTHRQILKAHWENTGVITGLTISGRSDLTYSVAAGVAVCSRGAADGYTEAYWPGGNTPAVAAGGANPRIDVIWIRANDPTQGDADNHVTIGVTQGAASATPVKPSAPAGCTEIGSRLLPANASNTNGSTANDSVAYAIPHGAGLGLLGQNVNTADLHGDSTVRKWYYENAVQFTVPTDRVVELVHECTFAVGEGNGTTRDGWISWAVAAFQIDGVDIPHSGAEFQASNGVWEDHSISCITTVKAGTHVARVRNGLANSSKAGLHPYFRYSENNGISYKGRTLRVWDRGVAR
ncbi:hypothetical protein [Bifidobacterium olomucense]|uniref:Uncharacterized protein n=1 Tax=Bifidobacterium olomucense TaxID=2675324 RepID=A0A7Y0HXB7_9BIFI|nr:hypothetical protein [Bifidobacterium sp. DSM 109959]NMM98162.1 hypothetical protein [Bifidobacterium sp. DSM 109959]